MILTLFSNLCLCIYLMCVYTYVHSCVSVWVHTCHSAHVEIRGQVTWVDFFLPPFMSPGIRLRSPGLAVYTFTHGTILQALYNPIFNKATNEDTMFFHLSYFSHNYVPSSHLTHFSILKDCRFSFPCLII